MELSKQSAGSGLLFKQTALVGLGCLSQWPCSINPRFRFTLWFLLEASRTTFSSKKRGGWDANLWHNTDSEKTQPNLARVAKESDGAVVFKT